MIDGMIYIKAYSILLNFGINGKDIKKDLNQYMQRNWWKRILIRVNAT